MDEAEVRLVGRRLVDELEMQLVVAAGAVPDEPRRIELREHGLLLEAEQAAVERARPLRPSSGIAIVTCWSRIRRPSAAYTSSYARTASFAACASRSAASSIRAATPSMNRHWSTERLHRARPRPRCTGRGRSRAARRSSP